MRQQSRTGNSGRRWSRIQANFTAAPWRRAPSLFSGCRAPCGACGPLPRAEARARLGCAGAAAMATVSPSTRALLTADCRNSAEYRLMPAVEHAPSDGRKPVSHACPRKMGRLSSATGRKRLILRRMPRYWKRSGRRTGRRSAPCSASKTRNSGGSPPVGHGCHITYARLWTSSSARPVEGIGSALDLLWLNPRFSEEGVEPSD